LLPLPARRPPPRSVAAHLAAPGAYWTFYWAVVTAQLARWLPRDPSVVLDLSGPRARCTPQAAGAGHQVIEVLPRPPEQPPGQGVHPVVADPGSLGFLADESVDAVIAEDRVLSRHLVTEATVGEIARVLRPGGRVLLCVDSLTLGMAVLAEQDCWAHLSDVPRAEVVLVPWPDGRITRCFWAEQLRELLVEAGLEVEWIRPRTVLSPSTVEHVLARNPRALTRLVRTELAASANDESLGVHLVASARKIR
jgi:SAM-dependent methyltransferase